jgi:divalent metal cation (Fe/Co/Zn/Cd) transporter
LVAAALRRLLLLTLLAATITAAFALGLGVLIGSSAARSVSLGFYAVGCFLMVAGFFVGNRGPARVKSESPGAGFLPFPLFGDRRLRWATADEREEAINMSAVYVALGFLLVLIGIAVDSRHSLV